MTAPDRSAAAGRDRDATLRRLGRTARWTALRLRVDETLSRAVLLLPLPLLFAVGALTWIKVARPLPATQHTVLLLGLVPLVVFLGGTLYAWFHSRPRFRGAMALDRHHGLHDRITNALSFTELPPAKRTPLMDAAIEDAVTHARDLTPRRAAPLHVPRELPVVVLLIAALAGVALLEVRTTRVLPPEKHFDPLVMSPDDIDLFRQMAQDLEKQTQDPETAASVRRFNQLIEDIAQHRLDRAEVFKRMAELDRELSKGEQADKEAMEAGLKNMAEELAKADLSKPISAPLKQKNLTDAEKAMRDLAEALKHKQKVSKQQLDQLRAALKKASSVSAQTMKNIEARRQQLEEERKSLLKKKNPDGGLDEQNKRLLKKKDRQLERLDREKDQAKRAQRQLSKLDRELAQAAEDMLREAGLSSKDLEQAAEDINRMAREQMSDKEKEDLRRRLQELRELLRQQGKGGKERLQRLLRFARRAHGQKGEGGQGQGKEGGAMRGAGKGQEPGQGQGQGGSELVVGAGSKSIPIPGMGSGQGQGQGSGQGQGDTPGGQGAGQGGKSWGTGHDDKVAGAKSELKGHTKDVTAAAADTGQGTASSQVIYGAAQRGFVGRGYKKVYTDYQTVAEQVMNQDKIPPGYRFYVQRYFQLIRPRE